MVCNLLIAGDRSSKFVDLSKEICGIFETPVCHTVNECIELRGQKATISHTRIGVFLLVPFTSPLVTLACIGKITSLQVYLSYVFLAICSLSKAAGLCQESHSLSEGIHSI